MGVFEAQALPDGLTLEAFLLECNKSWGPQELRSVRRKLGCIGVSQVADLLRYERSGVLNDLLAAAGERRFSAETLAQFRAAGEGRSSKCTQEGDEAEDADDLEELLNDFLARAGGQSWSQAGGEEAALRKTVSRGLAYIDDAAREVHRRNASLSRCLEEVQSDLSRISERMQAARRERQRGRAATANAASRILGAGAAPAASARWDEAPRKPAARAPQPPRRPQGSQGTTPCARAAQEGFSFGGWGKPQLANPRETLQDTVRAEIAHLKHEKHADQKAAIKRLLVKWHPDRNPESPETATAIFQFIQQEKDRLLGLR
ncbi:unnamed protein product [Effrenium voratum]|uniref:J domain-containing protein n=1 Tax=Effrenium voratum TaxID=2562239 RepID=A0AA36I6Y7_9DINO|nr:unnamed protein product [Effrenium voratum]CAJ1445481.1 unnamed protein product [Effrenium voratum]